MTKTSVVTRNKHYITYSTLYYADRAATLRFSTIGLWPHTRRGF